MSADDMPVRPKFDAIDARILLVFDEEPAASILRIASLTGMSRNTVHARMQRMQRDGVLRSFSTRLDPTVMGFPLTAFISLEISQRDNDGLIDALERIPEILEVHRTTGDADLLVKVAARDTEHLHRVTDAILGITGVRRSNTVVALAAAVPYRMTGLLRRRALG